MRYFERKKLCQSTYNELINYLLDESFLLLYLIRLVLNSGLTIINIVRIFDKNQFKI